MNATLPCPNELVLTAESTSSSAPSGASIDSRRARYLAVDHLAAWNSNDVARIMRHYDENVCFVSPLASRVLLHGRWMLQGRIQLQRHVEHRLASFFGTRRFTFIDALAGVDGYAAYYVDPEGRFIVDCVKLNPSQQALSVFQFIGTDEAGPDQHSAGCNEAALG